MTTKHRSWKRPENVPFPSVWKRFKGRKEINGVVPNFWIQDIPEDEFNNTVDFMMSGFPYDEPLNKYANLSDDLESMNSLRLALTQVLQDKVGLICYTDNPKLDGKPIIAGVNCTHVKTKWDVPEQVKGDVFSRIFATMDTVINLANAFDILETDVLLTALGLYVHPNFRGQGLGLEILKAREDICKAVGIKASVTTFTAKVSQVIAERAGFKTLSELSYKKISTINPRLVFPGIEEDTEALKYMYKKF